MLSIFLFAVIFSFLCALFSTPETYAHADIVWPVTEVVPFERVTIVPLEEDTKCVSPEQLMMAWAALYNLPAKN